MAISALLLMGIISNPPALGGQGMNARGRTRLEEGHDADTP